MVHFKFSLICCIILAALTHNCEASIVLPDSGFEDPNSSSFWVPFGTANFDAAAPGIDSSVEGLETLELVGNGDGATFSGVFQDVFIDGITLNVGNQVAVTGLLGQTSGDPLAIGNTAYLEVSFVDSSNNEFDFGLFQSVALDSNSTPDVYLNGITTFATVPSNAVAVRVKAVFEERSVDSTVLSGAARFDNLGLVVVVPEPASGFMFAVGFLAVLARRRR